MTEVDPTTQAPVLVNFSNDLLTKVEIVSPSNPLPVTSTPSGTQNENLVQINGATVSAGAGATGTGSQRVTVAQDTTTIAGSAPGTAGTPSSNVITVQGNASGTPIPVSGTVTETAPAATTVTTSQITVPATASGIQILATNASRKGASVYNPGSVPVFIAQTNAVTTASGYIPPFASLEIDFPNYTSSLFGIVTTGTQVISVVEFT